MKEFQALRSYNIQYQKYVQLHACVNRREVQAAADEPLASSMSSRVSKSLRLSRLLHMGGFRHLGLHDAYITIKGEEPFPVHFYKLCTCRFAVAAFMPFFQKSARFHAEFLVLHHVHSKKCV